MQVEKLRAQLREEQHKSDARIAALEEVNRDTLARAEGDVRNKMRAVEADCKAKVDKALAEAAERTARVEKAWREQLDKSEQQRKTLVATLGKEVSDAKLAAQGEAQRAFGNSSVFLERYVERAKHIEVQILGDKQGNVVHLHERDCSVQRRHQKVVEIAPSIGLPDQVREDLCNAAVQIASSIGYYSAGTVEFLYDLDTDEWFFIEMNPRIQVEHTVTEVITGIDIVRSQVLIAQGHSLHSKEVGIPQQADIPRNGVAIQARITTEDPEKNFAPDYGKIVNYRSAAGFGIRLDGAMGDTGAVITPFYDSLLVKLTASASTFELAIQRMDRALSEMRIRGVKTNIPFIENVVNHPIFVSGQATTTLIDTSKELFNFKRRRDRATKLLNLLGETIVNGNDQVKGRPVPMMDLVDMFIKIRVLKLF